MIQTKLKGMGVALITPFKEDESVDYDALMRLVDYLLQNNADFLCVLGTTAETPTLSEEEKKKFYNISELEKFMTTQEYKAAFNGVVDKRNSLNDLTGKEWLPETKSYLYQRGLGADSPEAQIEKQHPAPYSFQDIGHLIRFFTKEGMLVLDPFGGVGSTAKACEVNNRICTSIELSKQWHDLSIERLETEVGVGTCLLYTSDAADEL